MLDVGVDGDELDLRQSGIDHPIERVQAGAADSDHLDHGQVGGGLAARHAVEPRRLLRQRLQDRGRLGNRLEANRLGDAFRLGLRVGHCRYGRFLLLQGKLRNVLDRLFLRLDCLGRRRDLGLRLGLSPLFLGSLGRAEELRERPFTHARAAPRH